MAYCIFLVMNSFHKWNYLFLSLVFSIESFEGHLELGQNTHSWPFSCENLGLVTEGMKVHVVLLKDSKGDKNSFLTDSVLSTIYVKLIIFQVLNMNVHVFSYNFE